MMFLFVYFERIDKMTKKESITLDFENIFSSKYSPLFSIMKFSQELGYLSYFALWESSKNLNNLGVHIFEELSPFYNPFDSANQKTAVELQMIIILKYILFYLAQLDTTWSEYFSQSSLNTKSTK